MNHQIIARAKPQLVRKNTQVILPKNITIVFRPSRIQTVALKNLKKVLPPPPTPPPITPIPAPQPSRTAVSRSHLIKPRRTAKRSLVKYITNDANPESYARIANLHNRGKGKILIIVGNGPSILEADLPQLRTHPKIEFLTVNKPDQRVWPTQYWAFFDISQFRRHEDLWNGYNGYIFNSTAIKRQKSTSMQFKNLGGHGWSRDLLQGLHVGRSSVFASMQIAAWLNHEHIYIFGCLPDGEKILTSRGMIPIDSLLDKDLVYSSSGFLPWTNHQRRWYEGTIVSITTRMNNIHLRLTTEHPVLINRNHAELFIKADELIVGDYAVYPIDKTEINNTHTTDFWWLVGAYAAEGYIRRYQNNKYRYAALCLGKHETSFHSEIARVASTELGCKVTGDTRDRSSMELVINNDYFGRFVEEHIGCGSITKFISVTIMQLPFHKQAAFIKGYCQGDGSLFRRLRTNTDECVFSTASENLAEGLQKILLRLAVISKLTRSKRPSGFDQHNRGTFGVRHHICITGRHLAVLADWCDWSIKPSSSQSLFGTRIENDKLLVQITKLHKELFNGYVNNIEVAGPHTFASRLLMTHNCDMDPNGLNGQLHFYGQNPDVKPDDRKARFQREAEHYDYAATLMTATERQHFTFCSAYLKQEFVKQFQQLDHRTAGLHILQHAATL